MRWQKIMVGGMILAVAFFLANNAAVAETKQKKGPALLELEAAAGKKIEDVKVPEPPKPSPVPSTSSEVKPSTGTTGGYNVGTSSGATKGGAAGSGS